MSGIFGSQGPQPPARPFGLGAGTPSRFPYPDRPQPTPAIGPGSGQVVRARQVIVSGTASGVFIYSPVPGPGNLIGSWTSAAGTDPFGNAYPQGINVNIGSINGAAIRAGTVSSSVIGNLGLCLNANPFFSGGSGAGWTTSGAGNTFTVVPASSLTSPPFPGYGAQVTFTTAGAAGDKFNGSADRFGVVVGNRYAMTAWVYSSNAVTVNAGLEFRNSSGTVLAGSFTSATAVAANTWTLVSTVQTAPAGAVTGDLTFWTSAATVLSVQAAQAFPQVQGIVDATTIIGAQFIATGSSGEILAYTGTPALNNLLASVSGADGVDGQGNAFKAGLGVYDGAGGFIQITESANIGIINFSPGAATHITKDANILGAVVNAGLVNEYEALQIQSGAAGGHNVTTVQLLSDSADGTLTGVIKFFYQNTVVMAVGNDAITANAPVYLATDTPPTPGATVIYEGGTGHALYKDSSGAVYDMGRITAHASNGSLGQTINAVAFTLITGMSVNVGVGIYRFKVVVDLTTAAAAGRWELQLGGTAVTSTVDYSFFWVSGAGVQAGAVHQTNITTTQLGPNPSVIGPYHATYEGIVRFTSAGTFTVTAATTIAADTFTVWDGSTMTCDPIV